MPTTIFDFVSVIGPPQIFEIVAVRIITPLALFVKVVWVRLYVPGVAIPVGLVDHDTVEPTGKLGIVYGLEVVQKRLSPEIDKPALPE